MLALLAALALASNTDRATLTEGVTSLQAPGALPGPMVATGGSSFVILTAGGAPLFVGASAGSGRIIAGGHESFLGADNLRTAGNARFFGNSLAWLARRPLKGLTVGELGLGGVRRFVESAGGTALQLNPATFAAQLKQCQVVCLNQGALDGNIPAQQAVVRFVKAGNGLIVVGPAWGWQQTQPGKDLRKDHSGNRIITSFGIAFADGTVDGPYSPAGAQSPLLTTESAMAALRTGQLTPNDVTTATATVQRALSVMPTSSHGLRNEITKLAKGEGTAAGPSRKSPITTKMPFSRLLATLQSRDFAALSPEKVRAYPSSADFPGAVPKGAGRVTRSMKLDTAVPEWNATGLYAAPGEVITIKIPDSARIAGLAVRIGSHTDELWHLGKWERFPAVSSRTLLRGPVTKVASPFGGTIFLDVPSGCKLGEISVEIANAVPALRFVLGETTNAEWQADLKKPTAPWVELEGKTVALSVPRWAVENLSDPTALMIYWDEVFAASRRLYAAPARPRKERYCVDRQISAGYMHSGYPIMTGDDVAVTFCDLAKLRGQGNTWGFYHELGHNFQQGAWTFDGTGEVTCNLLSLYGSEVLNGITPAEYGKAHPAVEYQTRQKRLQEYLAQGAPFSRWKSDPFLALTMYIQLREAFGWEPYKQVFAEYEALPQAQQPRTEQEQHDQWMTRMSRATKSNLGPFFRAWGVPVSAPAVDGLKDLPAWMPRDWPTK